MTQSSFEKKLIVGLSWGDNAYKSPAQDPVQHIGAELEQREI